jgi:hypothetical protein
MPSRLVSGGAVSVFNAEQFRNVASAESWFVKTSKSVVGFATPVPRIFSLKYAVLLVPSVTLAILVELL